MPVDDVVELFASSLDDDAIDERSDDERRLSRDLAFFVYRFKISLN